MKSTMILHLPFMFSVLFAVGADSAFHCDFGISGWLLAVLAVMSFVGGILNIRDAFRPKSTQETDAECR
jgi:hypothetical protein